MDWASQKDTRLHSGTVVDSTSAINVISIKVDVKNMQHGKHSERISESCTDGNESFTIKSSQPTGDKN